MDWTSRDESFRADIWSDRERLDSAALAARKGNRNARNLLWIAAIPRLERLALHFGARPEDVPDLIQETILSAYLHLNSFDPHRGSFRSWLITILLHLKKNLLRARVRRIRLHRGLSLRYAGSYNHRNGRGQLNRIESRLKVVHLLPALPSKQRAVLVLYGIGGLSAQETGLILGITPGGVRAIARDARHRLWPPTPAGRSSHHA